MTISTTTTTITYIGNGATTVFTFPFVGDSTGDIVVTYVNSSGVSTILGPTQYGIVLNSVPSGGLWGIGGAVTYPLSGGTPIAVGTQLAITREVPYTQSVSISNQGAFYPQAVEQALDILELQIQQLVTAQEYSLQVPVTDPVPPNVLPSAAARANGLLGFDANGQPVVVFSGSGNTPTPGQFANPRRIAVSGTNTTNILITDSFAGVSISQAAPSTTTLQLPATEGPWPIFDASGNAGTYPVTILPSSGKTINGQASYIMAFNYQSITVYFDGNQFLVA